MQLLENLLNADVNDLKLIALVFHQRIADADL